MIELTPSEAREILKQRALKQKSSLGETLGDAFQGGLNSATLGYWPKIGAALSAMPSSVMLPGELPKEIAEEDDKDFAERGFSKRYHEARDKFRNMDIQAAKRSPISHTVGGLLGGALSPSLIKGGTLAKSAAQGAASGLLSGIGTSDSQEGAWGLNEKLLNSLDMASTGATLSAGLHGLGRVTQKGTSLLSKKKPNLDLLNVADEYPVKGKAAREGVEEFLEKPRIEDKDVQLKYQIADSVPGSVHIEHLKTLPSALRNYLYEDMRDPSSTKSKIGIIQNALNQAHKNKKDTLSLKHMNNWHRTINEAIGDAKRAGDSSTVTDLSAMNRIKDQHLDNAIEKAFLENKGADPTNKHSLELYKQARQAKKEFSKNKHSLELYKQARQAKREFAKKYTDFDENDVGGKFVKEIVEDYMKNPELLNDEIITNKIFGNSKSGFKPETPLIINKFAEHNKKAADLLKTESIRRIIDPLMKQKGKLFADNLDNLVQNHPTLIKALFTPKEFKELQTIATLASTKYSNTPSKLNALLLKGAKLIPGVGKVLDIGEALLENSPPYSNVDSIKQDLTKEFRKQTFKHSALPNSYNKVNKGITNFVVTNKGIHSQENAKHKKGGQVKIMTRKESLIELLKKPLPKK